mgnify:CR=1 FL=1
MFRFFNELKAMTDEIKAVNGVKSVLGKATVLGPAFPEDMIPEEYLETRECPYLQKSQIRWSKPAESAAKSI